MMRERERAGETGEAGEYQEFRLGSSLCRSRSQTFPFGKRGKDETLLTLRRSKAQQVVPTGRRGALWEAFSGAGCRHRSVHRTHPV